MTAKDALRAEETSKNWPLSVCLCQPDNEGWPGSARKRAISHRAFRCHPVRPGEKNGPGCFAAPENVFFLRGAGLHCSPRFKLKPKVLNAQNTSREQNVPLGNEVIAEVDILRMRSTLEVRSMVVLALVTHHETCYRDMLSPSTLKIL